MQLQTLSLAGFSFSLLPRIVFMLWSWCMQHLMASSIAGGSAQRQSSDLSTNQVPLGLQDMSVSSAAWGFFY